MYALWYVSALLELLLLQLLLWFSVAVVRLCPHVVLWPQRRVTCIIRTRADRGSVSNSVSHTWLFSQVP